MRSLLAASVLVLACDRAQKVPPPEADIIVASEIGLTDSALAIIREIAAGPLSGLHPMDSGGMPLPAAGVSFGLAQRKTESTMARLRVRLGAGHLVFISQRGYGITPDSIGIIAGTDQFQILRVRNTDGANYEISSDSVLVLARLWDKQFGLEITGAALDWFEARILRPPADYRAFANLLYEICPDIVTQGVNTVAALIADLRRTNTLYCWWD